MIKSGTKGFVVSEKDSGTFYAALKDVLADPVTADATARHREK
jgi:hypothetical protein